MGWSPAFLGLMETFWAWSGLRKLPDEGHSLGTDVGMGVELGRTNYPSVGSAQYLECQNLGKRYFPKLKEAI